jgi:uncharacterized protein involved in exopolysaccharide biosynthesis
MSLTPLNHPENALGPFGSATRGAQPGYLSPPLSQDPDLDLLYGLRRHWRLAILVFLVTASVGAWWVLDTMPPIYQAQATIYIPPVEFQSDSGAELSETLYPTLLNQRMVSILHYNTLSQALQIAAKKGVRWKVKGETEREAVNRLQDALEVERIPNSFVVSIQLSSSDPRTAAAIPNAVAQSFLSTDQQPDVVDDQTTILLRRKSRLEKELQNQIDVRTKLSASMQMIRPENLDQESYDAVLRQTRTALADAHRQRVEAEARLTAAQGDVPLDASKIADIDQASSIRSVREANLRQWQAQLRDRIKTLLPSHPVRKAAEAEIAAIDAEYAELKKEDSQAISAVTARTVNKIREQVGTSDRAESDLARELTKKSLSIPVVAKEVVQADFVNSEIILLQSQLTRIQRQLDQNKHSGDTGSSPVFTAAEIPLSPVQSHRDMALCAVFAMAFLLALGLPISLDLIDSRIYDPATIERVIGFPAVGMTIKRTPKTEHFADEHLRRIAGGIERGISDGARNVLFMGLKHTVSPALMLELSRELSDRGIDVQLQKGPWASAPTSSMTECQTISNPRADFPARVSVVLMDAPALVFSAEAERLAVEADLTLLVVLAGINTRSELTRGARLLERLNIPMIGVILQEVQVDHAGKALRRDLKEFMVVKQQFAGFASTLDQNSAV